MKKRACLFALLPLFVLCCCGCEGIFSGIYDKPVRSSEYGFIEINDDNSGTIHIDATSYARWTYIRLKGKINEDMIARLREFFTDEQIVLLDAFGAIMIATNLINSSLKVDLDGYLAGYVSRR